MPVEEVWFRHDCAQNSAEMEEHFNAPVKFSQVENLLFFKREFLRERFYTSNNLLFDILGDALNTCFAANSEHHGFVDVVSREIMRLPLAQSGDGLPIGVMLSGRVGEDRLLLSLAAQLERATPWHQRRPRMFNSH